jgi:hypothetical protein
VTLFDYRREVQAPQPDPARKRPLGGRGAGQTPQQVADDVTGHRSEDTAAMYIRQQNPFDQDLQDADEQ